MKIILLIILIFFINYLALPQQKIMSCSTSYKETPQDLSQRGGKYITSLGTLKVLVVFAKFKDDNSPNQYWPADSYPKEMKNFIDSSMDVGSTHYLNLTNYYNQMSFGNFKVIGKSIGVETPYPISHHIQGNDTLPNRVQANKDILLAADDSINYKEFDNWTYETDYWQKNQPDHIVDMIVVIWRGLVFGDQWSGEASLGRGEEFSVENNQEKIRMGFGGTPGAGSNGSGVTVQYWGERPPKRNFKNVVHEIAHWLISAYHPYTEFNHTFWGMLTPPTEGVCANSFERERLGWLNPILIDGTILSAPIGDYVTTPSAYKYYPSNGYPGESFYFENHQKVSIYDDATTNPNDKGIFILHFANDTYQGDNVRVVAADGFWNWGSSGSTNVWGNYLPTFRKVSINRNGLGNMDKIIINDTTKDFIYSFINSQNQIENGDYSHGFGFNDSFNTESNDVFSPWSNPPAYTWSGQPTNFLMEVMNQSGTIITVRFTSTDAWAGKPSKPFLGFWKTMDSTNTSAYGNVSLAWGADLWDGLPIEPDINWSELQMSVDSISWNTIYQGSDRFWTGNILKYNSTNKLNFQFRARVRDNQNQWSMWSNIISRSFSENTLTSINDNPTKLNNGEKLNYSLEQNYPNPFNPSTTIGYKIPKEEFVLLKVYNELGREIKTLVDKVQPAGNYKVIFNARNLASGIYIYTIKAGSFYQVKKLILLK